MNLQDDIKPGYDRVTTVLSFCSGMDKIPQEILKNASDRGTRVHTTIDAMLKGLMVFNDPDIEGYLESYRKWAKDKFLNPSPGRFYCDDDLITGEIDSFEEQNGEVMIYDFKTSSKANPTWALQASAYRYLAIKSGYKVSSCIMVKLDKNGKDPVIYDYGYDYRTFQDCLNVYRTFFKNKPAIEWEDI